MSSNPKHCKGCVFLLSRRGAGKNSKSISWCKVKDCASVKAVGWCALTMSKLPLNSLASKKEIIYYLGGTEEQAQKILTSFDKTEEL